MLLVVHGMIGMLVLRARWGIILDVLQKAMSAIVIVPKAHLKPLKRCHMVITKSECILKRIFVK